MIKLLNVLPYLLLPMEALNMEWMMTEWLLMTMVLQPPTPAMKDSILMVPPPEHVEMVLKLWDHGMDQSPSVIVCFVE